MNIAWVRYPMSDVVGFDILGLYKEGMKAYFLNSVLHRPPKFTIVKNQHQLKKEKHHDTNYIERQSH